jgi:hypothetical protein
MCKRDSGRRRCANCSGCRYGPAADHAFVRIGFRLALAPCNPAGDQSAALVASLAAGQPEALVNLGTGGFVICHLPEDRRVPQGYLQTLVWQDHAHRVHLAVEGTLNSIAAALAPYPVAACRVEELGSDDIFCLAEPSGLGRRFRGISASVLRAVEHCRRHRAAAGGDLPCGADTEISSAIPLRVSICPAVVQPVCATRHCPMRALGAFHRTTACWAARHGRMPGGARKGQRVETAQDTRRLAENTALESLAGRPVAALSCSHLREVLGRI